MLTPSEIPITELSFRATIRFKGDKTLTPFEADTLEDVIKDAIESVFSSWETQPTFIYSAS